MVAWTLALNLWNGPDAELPWGRTGTTAVLAVVAVAALLLQASRRSVRGSAASYAVRASASAAAASSAVAFLMLGPADNGVLAVLVGGIATFTLFGLVQLLSCLAGHGDRTSEQARPVVIVGPEASVDRIVSHLSTYPMLGYSTAEVVTSQPGDGSIQLAIDVLEATDRSASTTVIVAPGAVPLGDTAELTSRLHAAGLDVHLSAGLFGIDHRRLHAVPLAGEPFFYVQRRTQSPVDAAVKRGLDFTLALLMLVLTAPIVAVAALATKVSDRGPVLFRQQRVGRDGRAFTILKMRTMVVDAEKRLAEIEALNERSGPLFKVTSDPRITKVGRILRATSIDELPQLVNVLRGDMSLVGPRPALLDEAAQFDASLRRRLEVRPGITGLWQVEARNNPSFDAYRHLDLFYVENRSLRLDLRILWRTATVILTDILPVRGAAPSSTAVDVRHDAVASTP